MAMTEMSLPIDIPWKRMGVSKDMIHQAQDPLDYLQKWQSSISIFYYEPPDVPPEYCNRKVTYLKIVCTLTSFQLNQDGTSNPLPDFSGLLEDGLVVGEVTHPSTPWPATYKSVWIPTDSVNSLFPCYGALLLVAVLPSPADGVALEDYPYISAFQPQKREMYEVLSESGEMLSQSTDKANVLKGTTNTNASEKYNMDLGGGGFSIPLIGGGPQSGQKQEGTIARDTAQNQNVTNIDASREKRESSSYTTNVNQLYTLLQGYHLGTNRAMFYLQPRPHIQDQKFTFVRGLRRLEGIQEFFFILNRPASVPGFCVDAVLETAHVNAKRAYRPRIIPESELYISGNLNKLPSALGVNPNSFPSPTGLVDNWNRADIWHRSLAIHYLEPGIDWNLINSLSAELPFNSFWQMIALREQVPNLDLGNVALILEEYEADDGTFFVAARRLHSCVSPGVDQAKQEGDCAQHGPPDFENSATAHVSDLGGPFIVFEATHDGRNALRGANESLAQGAASTSLRLNDLAQSVGEIHRSSLASGRRYPYDEVTFLQADFIQNEMAQLIRWLNESGMKDKSLTSIRALKPLAEHLAKVSNVKKLSDLATVSTKEIGAYLQVKPIEARRIRSELLIEALQHLDLDSLIGKTLKNPLIEQLGFRTSKIPRVADRHKR
jgi:hypothetical protein